MRCQVLKNKIEHFKEIVMRFFFCFISTLAVALLFLGGCDAQYNTYQSPYQNNIQHIPQPPPEDYNDVKTLNIVLLTDPGGAEIYADWKDQKTRLGTSPMDLKISFCEYDGVVWFKDPPGWSGPKWFRTGNNILSVYPLYIGGQDFYGMYIWTEISGTADGKYLSTNSGNVPLTDGYRIQPFGFPVKLVKHGRVLSREFAQVVNSDDYYGAEELRLRRIDELDFLLKQSSEVANSSQLVYGKTFVDKVQGQLMVSEIDQLKHTVGLLDPQLMAMRKQLVAKLQAGDMETAFALAQAVSTMERRYFPEPPPQQIIVQAPNQDFAQPTIQSQVAQGQGKQEIIIQQKPYYGAQNIVEAIGAMRGSKLDPEAYQKALGGAQLLDIMGFGSMINK